MDVGLLVHASGIVMEVDYCWWCCGGRRREGDEGRARAAGVHLAPGDARAATGRAMSPTMMPWLCRGGDTRSCVGVWRPRRGRTRHSSRGRRRCSARRGHARPRSRRRYPCAQLPWPSMVPPLLLPTQPTPPSPAWLKLDALGVGSRDVCSE